MATKLKNILRNKWFKTLIYILFGLIVFVFFFNGVKNYFFDENGESYAPSTSDAIYLDDFYESQYAYNTIADGMWSINTIAENIFEKNNQTDEKVSPYKDEPLELYKTYKSHALDEKKDAKIEDNKEYAENNLEDEITFLTKNSEYINDNTLLKYDPDFSYYFETFDNKKFASQDLQGMSEEAIKELLKSKKLNAYIEAEYSNMYLRNTFSTSKRLSSYLKDDSVSYHYNAFPYLAVAYIAYNDARTSFEEDKWYEAKENYTSLKKDSIWLFIAGIVLFLILITGAGRKPNSDERIEFFFDAIFVELKALAFIVITVFILANSFNSLWYSSWHTVILPITVASIMTFFAYLFLITSMSIVRNIKSKEIRKRFLLVLICIFIINIFKYIGKFFEAIFMGNKLNKDNGSKYIHRLVNLYVLISAILMIFAILFILEAPLLGMLTLFLELLFTTFFIIKINSTLKKSNEEFELRVIEASKSEKTKTELITNVSHDLKTPLTSIIGYVDLLKAEDMSDVAHDYVKILEQKSEKLKDIISDLFVLSKSESGNLDIDFEKLDLKRLIEQTLADMNDKLINSGFTIKSTLTENKVYINSDGKKLYRILQNLIDNALKYSLKGSRIFIDLIQSENKVLFRIKNTASYEMNFSKEEITTRFVRGDKSRTEDGSGLGLAIAESFTSLLNGKFDLKIDGDVFMVELVFKTIN